MDALAALHGRTSVPPAHLGDPAPQGAALDAILRAGANAPDHGRLRPWRFLLIRGAARERLGEVFAQALRRRSPDAPASALDKERTRPLRAPLLIAVVAAVDPQSSIPEVEQRASAAAAAQAMHLAAHAQGFGSMWLTGKPAYDEHVRAALGLAAADALVAFLYVGTVVGTPPERPRAAATDYVREWHEPLG